MIFKLFTIYLLINLSMVVTAAKYYTPNRLERLSLAETNPSYFILEPYGKGTYAYGYEIDDFATGNTQFKNEEKLQNGIVQGSYGYVAPNGKIIVTTYTADEKGYRSRTETKPIESLKQFLYTNDQFNRWNKWQNSRF